LVVSKRPGAKAPGFFVILLPNVHFWANDDAVKLAEALRAALEMTNSKKD